MSMDYQMFEHITEAIRIGIASGLSEQPTLRDRFAMAALTGILAHHAHPRAEHPKYSLQEDVLLAFQCADIAMAAHEVEGEEGSRE